MLVETHLAEAAFPLCLTRCRHHATLASHLICPVSVQVPQAQELRGGLLLPEALQMNEKSARDFSARSFVAPPWGHGRPRVRVTYVRTGCPRSNACFSKVSRACPSFWPRHVRANDLWMSTGYPSSLLPDPKLCFPLLLKNNPPFPASLILSTYATWPNLIHGSEFASVKNSEQHFFWRSSKPQRRRHMSF